MSAIELDLAWSSSGLSMYRSGDRHAILSGHIYSSVHKIPVIYAHSRAVTGAAINSLMSTDLAFNATADVTIPILAGDLAGPTTHGNDPSITAVGQLLSWSAATFSLSQAWPDTREDRCALWGDGMGALTVLNWAARNPTLVTSIVLRNPIIDLEEFFDDNPSLQAEINTAYGGNPAFVAGLPTHSPVLQTAQLQQIGSKIKIWSTTDQSDIEAFAAAIGASFIDGTPRPDELAYHLAQGISAVLGCPEVASGNVYAAWDRNVTSNAEIAVVLDSTTASWCDNSAIPTALNDLNLVALAIPVTGWGVTGDTGIITSALADYETDSGRDTQEVNIVAVRGGCVAALAWARANPSRVKSIWLRDPVVDLIRYRNAHRSDTGVLMETAYGGYLVLLSTIKTTDPALYPLDLQSIGHKIMVEDTDPLVSNTVEKFAALVGAYISQPVSPHGVAELVRRTSEAGITPDPRTPIDPYLVAEAELEAYGNSVSQTMSVNYTPKFTDYVRDAGTIRAGGASRRFLGGDVIGAVDVGVGGFLWLGLDCWAGATNIIDPDDTFENAFILPFRNAVVRENTSDTLQGQLFSVTNAPNSGSWVEAVGDGGYPAATLWWPSGGTVDGGVVHMFASRLNPSSPVAFGLLGSDLITLDGSFLYDSHQPVTWGTDANFWPQDTYADTTAGFVYVFGTVVGYNSEPVGEDASFMETIEGGSVYVPKKLGRVPIGSMDDINAYTFWDGTGWSPEVTAAALLPMDDGNFVNRMTGQHRIAVDHWLGVARSSAADPHLTILRAEAPQGPYTKIARVFMPEIGMFTNSPFDRTWMQVSHFAQFYPHIPATAGTSIVGATGVMIHDPEVTAIPWDEINIRHWSPRFYVVPQEPAP